MSVGPAEEDARVTLRHGASPYDFAGLLRRERARLLDLLMQLDPVAWERPTGCPGWSVLGLAVHILGDDLALLAHQRDGYVAGRSPAGLDETQFIEWIDALQAEWVTAAAKRFSPRLVVDLLRWTDEPVAGLVAAQDASQVTAGVSWAGREPVPVWLDQGRELSERWIHRQQILEALGREDDLRADLAEPVLDVMRWAFPFRLGSLPRATGASIDITVTGSATAIAWHLRNGADGWEFVPQTTDAPIASMRLTDSDAWRLLTNNLTAQCRDHLAVDGDAEAVAILLDTRAIIGTPHWR
jgi:uncharacterized protein (TIGR03083 family)